MKRMIAVLLCAVLLTGVVFPLGAGARTAPQSIGKPGGFKVTATTATAIKIVWNKVKGVSGYQVCLSLYKTKGYKKVLTLSGANTTVAVVKKLKPSTHYYMAVRAFKGSDAGKFSLTDATTKKAKAGIATKTNVELKAGKIYTQFDFSGDGKADAFKVVINNPQKHAWNRNATVCMNSNKIQVIPGSVKGVKFFAVAPNPKLCFLVQREWFVGSCCDTLYLYKNGKFVKLKNNMGEGAIDYVENYVVSPTAINVVVRPGKHQREVFWDGSVRFYFRYGVKGRNVILKSRYAPAYGKNICYANNANFGFILYSSDGIAVPEYVPSGSRVTVKGMYYGLRDEAGYIEPIYEIHVQNESDVNGWVVPSAYELSMNSPLLIPDIGCS